MHVDNNVCYNYGNEITNSLGACENEVGCKKGSSINWW